MRRESKVPPIEFVADANDDTLALDALLMFEVRLSKGARPLVSMRGNGYEA